MIKQLILILIVIISLTTCSPSHNDKVTEIHDTISKVIKPPQTIATKEKSFLIGAWRNVKNKDTLNASFVLKDSTIYIPNQKRKPILKYVIKHDSLILYDTDYELVSEIKKATKDTLILITDGREGFFVRVKQ
jgi:hypothetical protein